MRSKAVCKIAEDSPLARGGGRSGIVERSRNARREKNALICLLVVAMMALPLSAFSSIKVLLYAAILVLELVFLLVDYSDMSSRKVDAWLALISTGFIVYLLLCWGMNGGAAIERLMQTAVFLLTVLVFSRYEWSLARIRKLKAGFAFVLVMSVVYWFASGRVTNYYSSFYGHSNGFAVILICACSVSLLSMDRSKPAVSDLLVFVVSLVLLVFANSRSAMAALIVTTVLPFILWRISRGKPFLASAKLIFFVVLAVVLCFTIVYPSLYGTQLGYSLEMLSREYLNKNFFSGREVVWKMILDAVSGHELFGLGLGMIPSMIYDTAFSSHNLYLQTILQVGIIGLVFVLAFLWIVLDRLGRAGGWQACVGASLVIGILVHECLEVSLTQNNFDVGLLFWVVMGVSMSASLQGRMREGDSL